MFRATCWQILEVFIVWALVVLFLILTARPAAAQCPSCPNGRYCPLPTATWQFVPPPQPAPELEQRPTHAPAIFTAQPASPPIPAEWPLTRRPIRRALGWLFRR